ncbi:MAG: hypothetical protein L0G22_01245 [Propionibacteriaceae bacterium]|nr:hypothetical protein [Propionibacteriaceae bacterium]
MDDATSAPRTPRTTRSAIGWVPPLAFVVAAILVITWVANLTIAWWFSTADTFAFETYIAVQRVVAGVLWWTLVAASAALAILLVTLWTPARPPARRGLLLVAIGLALRWGWWVLYRGISTMLLAANSATLATQSMLMALIGLVVELFAITLLIVGGLRVRGALRS